MVAQWSTGVSATSFIATAASAPPSLRPDLHEARVEFDDVNNNRINDAGDFRSEDGEVMRERPGPQWWPPTTTAP
jgi:hypothetical protein